MKTRRFLAALFVGSGLALAVGLSLGGQEAAAAESDLPLGATAEWWAAVVGSLESGGEVRSIGDGASDWTLTGEGTDDYFGISAATAGDVNGDGYADVVVGAYRYNGAQGRAYVYAGGPGGLSATPIFTATGEGTDNRFGISAATAGDVNGDGYADVVVGAYRYSNYQGRAYVYGGNGAAGRLVLARQSLGDGSGTAVQPWGRSPLALQVELNATSPLGRGSVRLQVEACPPGVPFGDGSCTVETAPTWTDVTTATSGIPLTLTVTVPTDSTLVRWRARLLYDSPLMIQGPWRRFLGQALEADVRVEPYRVFLPLVVRSY